MSDASGSSRELPTEPEQIPKRHYVSSDTDILTVDVPITTHSKEVLNFRLKLTQNEITSASGAFAGFLSGLVVCPLDVAKTRFQAQGAYLKSLGGSNQTLFNQSKYKGAFHSMGLIYKEEGIRGLYRGVVPITLGYFPTWMIYFTCYEHFKPFYQNITNDNDNLTYFASAISSGAISTTLTNPIWVVKTRLMLQMDNGKTIYDRFGPTETSQSSKRYWYKGTIDAFKTMYHNEGLGVFYRGLLPSYFGLVHVAIQFPLYENFKKLFHISEEDVQTLSMGQFTKFIFASCLSKMIASAITYPHEIVRTRMQLVSTSKTEVAEPQLKALVRVVKSIVHTEGIRGFYSGFVINLTRTVPASAVTLVSFEYFKRYFQRYS